MKIQDGSENTMQCLRLQNEGLLKPKMVYFKVTLLFKLGVYFPKASVFFFLQVHLKKKIILCRSTLDYMAH